ncbi:MAG: histidine phosphotransferase family protein [Rhodospirillales bacterium]
MRQKPDEVDSDNRPGVRMAAEGGELRLAQLMCSRLCHDLVGPAGAINAGVEFLHTGDGHDESALGLLAASGRQLTRRLAFYRVAFGLAGGAAGVMSLTEARQLACDLLSGGRIELDWPLLGAGTDPQAPRPLEMVRLVLCQVLIAAEALPRGGRLEVRFDERADHLQLTVGARGRDAGPSAELLAALRPDAVAAALTARTVPGHFAARLAIGLGASLRIDDGGGDRWTVSVAVPADPEVAASAA